MTFCQRRKGTAKAGAGDRAGDVIGGREGRSRDLDDRMQAEKRMKGTNQVLLSRGSLVRS